MMKDIDIGSYRQNSDDYIQRREIIARYSRKSEDQEKKSNASASIS